MVIRVVKLCLLCYNYIMTSREPTGQHSFPEYEGNQANQREMESLRNIGELLIITSTLIELIHAQHSADQIDYRLTFPAHPGSEVVLPDAVADSFTDEPIEIEITAGYIKPQDETQTMHTAFGATIISKNHELRIVREDTTADQAVEFEDLLLDTSQKNTDLNVRDEIRLETEEAFMARMKPVATVSQRELNALAISLAIFDGDSELFEQVRDKNLIDNESFLWLLEALREKALSANTNGVYLFQDGATELTFGKNDENINFTLSYTNPESFDTTIIHTDTSEGVDLRFSTYHDGVKKRHDPSVEDYIFFQKLLTNELNRTGSTTALYEEIEDTTDFDAVQADLYAIADQQKSETFDAGIQSILMDEEERRNGNDPERSRDSDN